MEIALPLVDEPGTRPGSTPVPKPARREKGWVRLLLSTAMGTLAVFVAACSSAPTSKAPERVDRQVAAARPAASGSQKAFSQTGKVSWYGREHAGKLTANGERFNPKHMTAAHRTLPFGAMVRVTRLDNGRSVVVRINDRGPFIKGRIVDVSQAAAKELDLITKGVAPCKVELVRSKVSSVPEAAPGVGAIIGSSVPKGRVVAQVRPKDF